MTERTQFTAWISKYALSQGIYAVEVEDCFDVASDMVATTKEWKQHFHGRDWCRTQAGAIERAEEMRVAKIASIKKQLAKLEAMSFGAPQ